MVEDVVEDVASVEEIEAEVVVELHAVQRGSVEEIVAEAEVVFVEETVGVLWEEVSVEETEASKEETEMDLAKKPQFAMKLLMHFSCVSVIKKTFQLKKKPLRSCLAFTQDSQNQWTSKLIIFCSKILSLLKRQKPS